MTWFMIPYNIVSLTVTISIKYSPFYELVVVQLVSFPAFMARDSILSQMNPFYALYIW